MILSFYDNDQEKVFNGEFIRRLPKELHKKALMRLMAINSAKEIEELQFPPSNRLHKLLGDRKNQWSISINDQYRICFKFENGNATDVEIVDYHQERIIKKTFNVHPGEILKEYLDEMEISAYKLSHATGISESNLSELINGKKNITARLSLLLGKFFGFNEEYWLRMQNHYDILEEKKKIKTKLKSVQIWGKSKVAV